MDGDGNGVGDHDAGDEVAPAGEDELAQGNDATQAAAAGDDVEVLHVAVAVFVGVFAEVGEDFENAAVFGKRGDLRGHEAAGAVVFVGGEFAQFMGAGAVLEFLEDFLGVGGVHFLEEVGAEIGGDFFEDGGRDFGFEFFEDADRLHFGEVDEKGGGVSGGNFGDDFLLLGGGNAGEGAEVFLGAEGEEVVADGGPVFFGKEFAENFPGVGGGI